MIVNFPKCGEPSSWNGNEWRPFCSRRCKLVDLGAWISEEYVIDDRDLTGEDSEKEMEVEEE
jgi:endogenous inhibitor of DNA gyrase (YacG/DUF329 family)